MPDQPHVGHRKEPDVGAPLAAGFRYFIGVFAIGFVLGSVRTLLLVPRLGDTAAVLLELPVMIAAAWIICKRLLRRHRLTSGGAAIMGAAAFALLMLAESGLSILLFRRNLLEHLSLYAEAAHLLGLAGQLAFAAFPWLQVHLAKARS